MTYHRLENSIIDVIKEEQAKLGYRKEEIRLYYPLSSWITFFETSADAEEMKRSWRDLVHIQRKNWAMCWYPIKGIDSVSIFRAGRRICTCTYEAE